MIDQEQIVAYLNPAHRSFWSWRDNDQDLSWTGGDTIAFRAEACAVIQRLAPGGLPPFAAIVLLLAATRDGWAGSSHRFASHVQNTTSDTIGDSRSAAGITLRAIGHRLDGEVASLIRHLNAVANLPASLRQPLTAKAELALMAFESAERTVSPQDTSAIVQLLQSNAQISTVLTPITAVRELVDIVDAFRKGLKEIDAEQISLRLRTGLDQPIIPPDDDLAPSEKVRQLLYEVTDDPALGGLSVLAKSLLAAVQVPRTLHRQQELPVGGVADMSNRGSLDRLLISELAHDDLTLAVRVAMNEALYLQRESPPRQPPRGRILVIDTGIRMWGVPRVFATAVALALSATGDADAELATFRPDGDQMVAVDFTTRAGLLSHLESLDPNPHFGEALENLPPGRKGDSSEVFLITHEDVLEDPDFRAAINRLDRYYGYIASVNCEGQFRLWSISSAGRKLVRQARLNLDRLFESAVVPARSLINPAEDLPLILSITPLPLLIPTRAQPRACALDHQNGVVELTADKRLVHYQNANQGPRQLVQKVPRGILKLLAVTDHGIAVAIFAENSKRGEAAKHHRVIVNLAGGQVTIDELPSPDAPHKAFVIHDDLVYFVGRSHVIVFNLDANTPLCSISLGGRHWVRGRIFNDKQTCSVLCYDGSRLAFETIKTPNPAISNVFESVFSEEIQTWDGSGTVILRDRKIITAPKGSILRLAAVSSDGRRLLAQTIDQKKRLIVTSQKPKWMDYPPTGITLDCFLSGTYLHRTSTRNLRNNISGIAVDDFGKLLLFLNKRSHTLYVDANRSILGAFATNHLHKQIPFIPMPPRLRMGFQLRVATWPDGSRAYLDSRGMLHLKSSNPKVNQLSLVLCDQAVAAWSSEDRCFGDFYFHGQSNAGTGAELDQWIRRFTEPLR